MSLHIDRRHGQTVELEVDGRLVARLTVAVLHRESAVIVRVDFSAATAGAPPASQVEFVGGPGTVFVLSHAGHSMARVELASHRSSRTVRLLFDAPSNVRIYRPEFRARMALLAAERAQGIPTPIPLAAAAG